MTPFGAPILEWALVMTLWTAVLVAAARVADRVLASRLSARARMALYGAAFVRLALPVRWSGGWAILDVARVVPPIGTASRPGAGAAAVADTVDVAARVIPWAAFVGFGVYALGVAALLWWRWIAYRRVTAGLRPARASVAALTPGARVFESDDAGPAVVGVVRPHIVVPTRLVESLDADGLAWIVRHEASHLTARDPLLLAALQLVVIALWPIAPLWFALGRLRTLIEVACDERTLASSGQVERRRFMSVLAEVAESGPRRVRLVRSPGFGGDAVERVAAIASNARRWSLAVQFAAALLVGVGLVACGSAEPPSSTGESVDSALMTGHLTDFVLLKVTSVPELEATAPGADGVDRPIGARFIESHLLGKKAGEAMLLRSSGGITMTNAGPIRLGGAADVSGMEIVAAPSLIAIDGNESSVALSWNEGKPDAQRCRATFAVAPAADGDVELTMSFEQHEGESRVREIAPTKFRVHEGDTYLVPARRPVDGAK